MTADAAEILARARTVLDPALRPAVSRLDARNRRIVEYHLGFADADGAPSATGSGKLIRGVLALLSGAAVAGDGSWDAALPGAVGVELVHQYSLLHDDIIDDDAERRHRPAAWVVFGSEATILAGDALAALAIECAFDGADPRTAGAVAHALASATRSMVAGQAADIAFERAETVSLDECLAMVADKTGALLACSASIGAVAAGAPASTVSGLAAFGRQLGLAFQLVDDVIGLWGSVAATGKPVGSDIASRKRSLPVVAALDRGGTGAARLAEIYATPGALAEEQIADALAAIERAGGRAWAQAQAAEQTEAALRTLRGLPIDDAVREQLVALTAMLCRRDT